MENIKDQTTKIMNITDGNICNRCLGRYFYPKVPGKDNDERGAYLKNQLMKEENLPEKNEPCCICGDLFRILENKLENIIQEINEKNVEFANFLVGCRLSPEILEKEKFIGDKIGVESESIKKEINRELGKGLSLRLDKEVEFDNPNLVVMMDFTTDNVEIQINPLFLEGRYRKLVRGIPQTRWPCRKCRGRGCEKCNYTGKMYPESVEELIAKKVLQATKGRESKFHGAGREDIDVRMLGRGRPFVLEIKEPKVRELELDKLTEQINQHCQDKVEVLNLKMAEKDRRSGVKASSTETSKTYRALVEMDETISKEDLDILNSLNVIKQRTPIRVSHRRADKIRVREVKEVETKLVDSNHFEFIVNCDGGLYIKELISGDEDRTQPSVTSLLGNSAKCVHLDVLEVNI
ncbi:tRNA pseudouridine(54/55) synthase Pus10 [Methanobacterium petrolearium]|uniref:tRNA pseudouridine(54/55) synthase Pus10 n=1 Tax=Methanobacterium petrolearium TaxID=710190 RepID=UPI001AE83A69|nr:tRNA pseudouridine(54/55) synthase Pus10 [Methanobacterium petrolearium]MBP1944711.1 tRNA pseudouridine synthase 10 [Methanobacterium petrolearium]BDZ69976.1 tRNA pseudouridine(54/55) synthase Pus10 [Methanobacterium petrolearium]